MTPKLALQPRKYKSIPFEIEAILFDGTNIEAICEWSGGAVSVGPSFNPDPFVNAPAGKLAFGQGEYIIKDDEGNYYPCKPEAFTQSYALVDWENNREGDMHPEIPYEH